jgi:hypothetical protein
MQFGLHYTRTKGSKKKLETLMNYVYQSPFMKLSTGMEHLIRNQKDNTRLVVSKKTDKL